LLLQGLVTLERQAFGKTGEDLAAAALERLGYAILERRYRTRYGEIDIVARDGDTLVFVEVKARASAEFGNAAEAVTPQKQRKLALMAADYLARHSLDNVACRFDVVAIDGIAGALELTVYADAFYGL
jgi:putative endonuclease